jgi:hypothetical protein
MIISAVHKLWATETNKFHHCIETDLFAAIFPTHSQYCTPEQISINIMDKSHISRIGAKQVKKRNGHRERIKERNSLEWCGVAHWRGVA